MNLVKSAIVSGGYAIKVAVEVLGASLVSDVIGKERLQLENNERKEWKEQKKESTQNSTGVRPRALSKRSLQGIL